MNKIFTILSMFSCVFFFHISASAKADAGCMKMLKQARKTCKADNHCIYEALNASGFNTVNTGTEVFCKGDPKKGITDSKKSAGKVGDDTPFPVRDRSKGSMSKDNFKSKSKSFGE